MLKKLLLLLRHHHQSLLLITAFFFINCLLYIKTIRAHFLFDWNTGLMQYLQQGIQGLAHCFNDNSMHWVSHSLNILVFEIFGTNAYGWHFTLLSWHALNGVLLMQVIFRLCKIHGISNSLTVSVSAALLWLVSPYQSEAVVWGGAMLHLAVSSFMFAAIHSFLNYLETGKFKYTLFVFAWYLLAMFTLENFLVLPVLLFIIYLLQPDVQKRTDFRKFALCGIAVMMLLNAAYFVANKWYIGKWVGHYGETAHLNTDVNLIIPNLTKYLSKLLYFPLFFSYKVRDEWYALLHKPTAVSVALVFYLLLFSGLSYLFFKTQSKTVKLSIGLFALCCVAMLPVINTYFAYSKDIEGDRYFYFMSAFFYASLSVIVYSIFKKYSLPFFAMLLVISISFLYRNNNYWYESGCYANALMNDFRWGDAKRVYVLLSPDSYCGAYCLRNKPEGTLTEMLYVQRGIDMNGKMIEGYQYNAMSPYDSASCSVLDSNTIEVKLHGSGGWLWYKSFGAVNTDNEYFTATLNEWYPWYTIRFKQKQPGDVFIFANNKRWQQIDNF